MIAAAASAARSATSWKTAPCVKSTSEWSHCVPGLNVLMQMLVIISWMILSQLQAPKGFREANRAPARQNGYGGGWQGSGPTQEWTLEEKRCTGDALLLPVWVQRPHQEGLSALQKPCRFTLNYAFMLYLPANAPGSSVTEKVKKQEFIRHQWIHIKNATYFESSFYRQCEDGKLFFLLFTPLEDFKRKGEAGMFSVKDQAPMLSAAIHMTTSESLLVFFRVYRYKKKRRRRESNKI